MKAKCKNIVIITGASSGIGLEFARKMDLCFESIDEFWLAARREDRLREAAGQLRHKTRLFPVDLTDSGQMDTLENAVMAENAVVRMLIQSAGVGYTGIFCERDTAEALEMLRLNCLALTELAHRMIPYMRRNSRIIQMASGAAFLPQPGFAVYAAAKSYVLSFSRALNRELKPLGIPVTCVCPGPVDTPFLDIAGQRDRMPAVKKLALTDGGRVAEQALRDSFYRRELSVCGLPLKALRLLSAVIPHRILLDFMAPEAGRHDPDTRYKPGNHRENPQGRNPADRKG